MMFIVKPENICTPVGRCGLQPGFPPVTGKGGSHPSVGAVCNQGSHPLLGRDTESCVKVITESTINHVILHADSCPDWQPSLEFVLCKRRRSDRYEKSAEAHYCISP